MSLVKQVEYFDLLEAFKLFKGQKFETQEQAKIRGAKYSEYMEEYYTLDLEDELRSYLEVTNDTYAYINWEYLIKDFERNFKDSPWMVQSMKELKELVNGCEVYYISW